jgi:16S rRNA (cytosine967-C5)-methyltransferase
LGYAACSPHLAETQVQVMGLLKAHPDLEQIPVDAFMPKNLEGATRSESMTLWTHIHGTDAMFLALFGKKSEVK